MIGIEGVAPFLIATVILNLTPGSDVLFVATQSIGHGIKGGILAALGVSTGVIFHILAVGFGLTELLKLYPLALSVVKILGASYLFYLAIISLRSKQVSFASTSKTAIAMKNIFIRGATTNILNPKVALFFLAFLPQFINPENGSFLAQTLLFGAIFIASATIVNIGYATAFSFARSKIQESKIFQRYLNRISAGVFGFMGAKLIVTD